MLSCLWTLLATIAIDRLWLAQLRTSERYIALALWCLSPAVLLYGRMGRSYLMQTALAVVAIALTWRFLMRPGVRSLTLSALTLIALLYTHYIPGLAVTFAFAVALLVQVFRLKTMPGRLAAVWGLVIAIAYLPWMLQFTDAVERWTAATGFSSRYELTGRVLTEEVLKVAYGVMSFTIGESFPIWSVAVIAPILILVALTVRPVWRRFGPMPWLLLLAALVGYLGVTRWVSYPFIPGRLLWLLPFCLMWIAVSWTPSQSESAWCWRRFSRSPTPSHSCLITSARTSATRATWFHCKPLLHASGSDGNPSTSLLMVDTYNTDFIVSAVLPGGDFRHLLLTAADVPQAEALLKDPSVTRVWIVRNTHDVSPGQIATRIETLACAGGVERQYGYVPYEAWERRAMVLAGIQHPPRYFYKVSECSPARTAGVAQFAGAPRRTANSIGNRATVSGS